MISTNTAYLALAGSLMGMAASQLLIKSRFENLGMGAICGGVAVVRSRLLVCGRPDRRGGRALVPGDDPSADPYDDADVGCYCAHHGDWCVLYSG
jgi:hypothetical protein